MASTHYQTHKVASTTFPEVTYQLGLSSTALAAREACRGYGGFLPYSYGGYEVGLGLEDSWHWVNYQWDSDCYASRPARWSEGVRRVDCQEVLSLTCERDRLYQHPVPPLPPLTNIISQPTDNFLPAVSRTRPSTAYRPRRRFYRRGRPYRNRYNFSTNPYFAFK